MSFIIFSMAAFCPVMDYLFKNGEVLVMANTLIGKIALVTAGSRGIGAAVVRRLASDGATVAFTYAASEIARRRSSPRSRMPVERHWRSRPTAAMPKR
jgi:hypothetical protein